MRPMVISAAHSMGRAQRADVRAEMDYIRAHMNLSTVPLHLRENKTYLLTKAAKHARRQDIANREVNSERPGVAPRAGAAWQPGGVAWQLAQGPRIGEIYEGKVVTGFFDDMG